MVIRKRLRPKHWLIAIIFVSPLLLIAVVLSGVLTWSEANSWSVMVDINTGRLRYTRHLFWIKVADQPIETSLSRLLDPWMDKTTPPEWRYVGTFSPGAGHSPHYSFHSAKHQIDQIEELWLWETFTWDAKRQVANDLVTLWQTKHGDDAVDDFIMVLTDRVESVRDTGEKVIKRKDLQ